MSLRRAHAPLEVQTGPTRLSVPPGSVDCHAHVVGLPSEYPIVDNRSFEPPDAGPEKYFAMLDSAGMTYGVLVQVSVHGVDNRLLVSTLKSAPERTRGIAVIPVDTKESELQVLKDAGVVGLRMNTLYGGGVGVDQIRRFGDLARDYGWHLQFLIDAKILPEISDDLRALQVPYVIDHYGHFPVSRGLDDPGFLCLLDLLSEGGWAKISGAYLGSVAGFPYKDTIPFAQKVFEVAPDRCVWGSDWPHVGNAGRVPAVGDLLDLLADWLPDESAQHKVLVENAHRLYGF